VAVAAEDHRFLVATRMRQGEDAGTVVLDRWRATPPRRSRSPPCTPTRQRPAVFCPADHYIPDAAAFGRT
jgi:mannose-1-phosphate guanylyltransferase/mannose-6-phosphate isomerase